MNQELQDRNEQLESLKQAWNDKNHSLTDTTQLKQIQNALAQLNGEIRTTELRIGVLSQSLLKTKMSSSHLNH